MFQMEKKYSRKNGFQIEQKNVTKETKKVRSENCFNLNRKSQVKVTKSSLYVCTAICGLDRATYFILWSFFTFMILHGLAWFFMVCYGLLWPCMALIDGKISIWTCMIFSRGHRSKFIWSCWIHQYILESGMIYRFRVVRGSFLFLCTRRSRMRSRFQKNKVVPRFSFLFMKCTIWKLLSVLNKRFEIFVTLWRPIYYVSYSTANVKIQSILV